MALVNGVSGYPMSAPFDPSEANVEWTGNPVGEELNPVYQGVRQLFKALEMDAEQSGTPSWNPLGEIIDPGNTVVLKPNLVSHRNMGERMYGLTDTQSLVTHGSIIRCVLDYVGKALQGHGTIVICDCPVQGTDWDQVVELVGLNEIAARFRDMFPGVELVLQDFRLGKAIQWRNTVVKRIIDEKARANHHEVDLGKRSLLLPLMRGEYAFGVSDYPRSRMRAAHTPDTNKYLFPKQVLHADTVINLPKMKVHMKAGITCSLKNFVGTIGHKDYLPHFRYGGPKQGGDEYPDYGWLWNLLWYFMHRAWDLDTGKSKIVFLVLARLCASALKLQPSAPQPVWSLGSGSWYGNDTLWRTVLDINRAFFYYNPTTDRVEATPYVGRRYFAILDGVIAGEKESPLAPTPKQSGFLLAARNPLVLDTVAAAVMGLDYRHIRQISHAWTPMSLPLVRFGPDAIRICGNTGAHNLHDAIKLGVADPFEPSRGFKGHIEAEQGISLE